MLCPYKNKTFILQRGGSCIKKNFYVQKNLKKHRKAIFIFSAENTKKKILFFNHTEKIKTHFKSFFFILLNTVKPFEEEEEDQYSDWFNIPHGENTLWGEHQYCINISFLLLSLLFLNILLNLLLIQFIFFILLIILYTNHFFYYFWYFDGWNGVNLWWRCTKTHGMPWVNYVNH